MAAEWMAVKTYTFCTCPHFYVFPNPETSSSACTTKKIIQCTPRKTSPGFVAFCNVLYSMYMYMFFF